MAKSGKAPSNISTYDFTQKGYPNNCKEQPPFRDGGKLKFKANSCKKYGS